MAHRAPGVPLSPQTREWPTPLRRLAKLSLGVIYAGSSVAGWHVVVAAEHNDSPWWSIGLGVLAGAGGVLALLFMLLELWMAERPAAWLVAFSLSVYALIDGARLVIGAYTGATDGPDVGGTALLYVSAAAVGLRIVHLWAFDLNLNTAKARAEDATRRHRPGGLV